MHPHFAEWYKTAGIPPNANELPKRWTAIESFDPNHNEIVLLTRLFYGRGNPDDDFLAKFRASFQQSDAAFPMTGNDQELIVLAGTELVDTIQHGSTDYADFAALCLTSALAQNLRGNPSVAEITEIAAKYLHRRTLNRGSEDENDAPEPSNDIATLQRELSIISEECNILWWLFSEYSRDSKEKWTEYSVAATALMAGKELSDLTRIIPGPPAALAILDRTVRFSKEKLPATVHVRDAINQVSTEWKQTYQKERCIKTLEAVMPLSTGVAISLTAPEKNQWLPAFVTRSGIPSDSKIAPHVLAYQVFLEGMLARSWKSLNKS